MTNILAIDIGGTRIKSAVFPEAPSLEQLKASESTTIRTLGWLNHSLPDLLRADCWAGLADYYNRKGIQYDKIAMSVPGPVNEQGSFLRNDLTDEAPKVPKNLRRALEEVSGRSVTLLKDADAWMMGFIRYAELIGEATDHPVMSIALGTGVGISVATTPNTIHSIEISGLDSVVWKQLRKCSQRDFANSWDVHGIIGSPFFEWVKNAHREWAYLTIRKQFSARILAALNDLFSLLEPRFGKLRTLVLAGGNAEFVSVGTLAESLNCRVIPLTDRHSQLKPDLISLLGVEAATRAALPFS